ncbi:MAG: hemolysin XhlA family protein [Cellulosilyticaceae bacterium]
MDEQLYKEIRKISEDMIFVKTTLENISNNYEAKVRALDEKYEEKMKVANHRIEDLEDQNKWLWRTIIAAVIVAIIPFFLK